MTVDLTSPPTLMMIITGGARIFGVLVGFPLFSLFNLTALLMAAVGLSMSLPLIFSLAGNEDFIAMSDWTRGVLTIKEFFVGVLLGVALGLPFRAIELAGSLIDLQRGAAAPNLFDPLQAVEATPVAQLLIVLALFVFVVDGGLFEAWTLVYYSFGALPIMTFAPPDPDTIRHFILDQFALSFRAAFVAAGPFLVLMLVADLAFGLLGRGAGMLPLSELSAALKNVAVLFCGILYTLFATDYLAVPWKQFVPAVATLFRAEW